MTPDPRRLEPDRAAEAETVSDEQLWSWIDRGAPELDRYLEHRPEHRHRVDQLRGVVAGVTEETGLPERIGHYRITGRLGRGGMGIVYEAADDHLARRVAVKVLRGGELSTEASRRRFDNEIRALSRLEHDCIARIYSAGTTDSGEPYFVMERVEGSPLHRYVESCHPDRDRRLGLFASICRAVAHAHDHGVIHRDLKPTNVMVDSSGSPKVLDFGLARVLGDDGSVSVIRSKTQAVLGTLPYMSPEQVEGRSADVDARSDVYSLGVMLYELLTGALPYRVGNDSLLAAVRTICDHPPRPPSHLDRTLRGDLERVVLRALAKHPDDRYRTVRDFAEDLRRAACHLPILARPPQLLGRASRWVRRHRRAAAMAGVLSVGAGTVAGVAVHVYARLFPPRVLAVDAALSEYDRSPFSAVRWVLDSPEVKVLGQWRELEGVAGVNVGLLTEFCRQVSPGDWQRHVELDLEQVLGRLGVRLGRTVDLALREPGQPTVATVRDVPVTRNNRRMLWLQRADLDDEETAKARADLDAVVDGVDGFPRGSPFDAVRVRSNATEVEIDGTWYEWLAIDGLSADTVVRYCRDAFGDRWQLRLRRDLHATLRHLGHVPGDEVLLDLREVAGGRPRRVAASMRGGGR